MRNFYFSCVLGGVSALAFTGCAAEAPGAAGLPQPQVEPDAGEVPPPETNSCESGVDVSQVCTCLDGSAGSQFCYPNADGSGASWGECGPCAPPIPDGPLNEGPCEAGYYTGTFKGTYWPGIADFGFGSFLPVEVEAIGTPGRPGLALTLEKEVTGGGEFVSYKVGDGCIVGTANAFGGLAGQHPFVGIVRGELDCETRVFTGTLRGYYRLFDSDALYQFEGPLTNLYETSTPPALTDGKWNVKELQSTAANPPGGEGTWDVTWQSAESGEIAQECADFLATLGGTTDTTTTP